MPKGIKGFQKGHPDFVTKDSRKKVGEKTKKRMAAICADGQVPAWLQGKSPFVKGHKGFGTKESYIKRGKKISESLTGKPQFHQRGEKSHMWKGDITPINARIRTSLEYKNWRRKVFERDDYTCRECGIRGGELHADHIIPFAFYPEMRFELFNGRTLCIECHKQTITYMGGAQKLWKFLGFERDTMSKIHQEAIRKYRA